MYQKEQLPDWRLDWKWFLPIDEKVDTILKKKLPCGCSFGVVVETVTVPNELHLQRPILLCGLLPLRLWSGL